MVAASSRRQFIASTCSVLLAGGCATRAAGLGAANASSAVVVYFGTYTPKGGPSRGIYKATLNTISGELAGVSLAAETTDPSYLAVAPNGRHLYAVNELMNFQGETSGAIQSFTINPNSFDLVPGNQRPTGGGAPCHLTFDSFGKTVIVANYMGGNVASFPLNEDGSLGNRASLIQHEGKGSNPRRQEAPHAHATMMDPAGKRVFVCDLGIDQILSYTVDETGGITGSPKPAGVVAPGSGPRHIAFHPTGRFAYVNNEMASSVTVFRHDDTTGTLTELQTISTLPAAHEGNSTAQSALTPDGRWLYVSNRGHNSLAIYSVDQESGTLTARGHQDTQGKTPRDFAIVPGGSLLVVANQDSDNVLVFRIDASSGKLTSTGAPVAVPRPVCVVFANGLS
jgi:6-phosphogluconolactonase